MSAAILCASSTLMPRGSANHPAKGDSSHCDKIPLSPSERDFRVKNAIQLAQGRQYQEGHQTESSKTQRQQGK
jgi:hypothetical protein